TARTTSPAWPVPVVGAEVCAGAASDCARAPVLGKSLMVSHCPRSRPVLVTASGPRNSLTKIRGMATPRPSPAAVEQPDLPDHVEVVRRFNRSYTQRIGVLEESFLGLGMPLGTARLLYEIGAEPGTTRDLRARLHLDSGYLSRLLRRLEADALVVVGPDPDDRRRRRVELTPAGRRAWAELERRSAERAENLVAPLTGRQRARLAAALAEADLLVRAATVRIEEVDPAGAAALAAVRSYVAELDERFPRGFAVGDLTAGTERLRRPDGAFMVATSDGVPAACGGVQPL